MPFIDIADQVAFAREKLRKVGIWETERLLFDVYCVLPGQSQKVHVHDDIDKVYVVLTGRPTLILSGEERRLMTSQAALCPAGVPHGLRNDGKDPATLLVFQARQPRPAPPETQAPQAPQE